MADALPVVRLRVGGARGHLHFFRKMVDRAEGNAPAGSLVEVRDRDGAFLGRGIYNPRSNIAVRLLSNREDEPSGEELIRARLRSAVALRHDVLRLPAVTDAYRLVHAEGDGLSGLIVDRLGPVLSIELFSLGMHRLLETVKAELLAVFPGSKFSVRADAEIAEIEGFRIPAPEAIEGVTVKEHGAEFRVDFARGHKTGFFCDQRDHRAAVGRLAAGRSVLDLCTYTGGFAVQAARGGASRVSAVDLDEKALETARQNGRLNRVKIDFRHADLFNYLKQSKETWDLVILDPPKLVRDREEILKARRGYHDMNALAMRATAPGGILVTCSCSGLVSEEEFLGIVRAAAETAGRTYQIYSVGGAGPDHPVSTLFPEGRYLKTVFGRVL